MWHCLSCWVSLPSASNFGARSEYGFRVLDVVVLPVLDPRVPDSLLILPFLFSVVWAWALDVVLPLSFDFSWLAEFLFTGVSLAASDWHSQYWTSIVCDRVHKSWRLLGFSNLEILSLIQGRSQHWSVAFPYWTLAASLLNSTRYLVIL